MVGVGGGVELDFPHPVAKIKALVVRESFKKEAVILMEPEYTVVDSKNQ